VKFDDLDARMRRYEQSCDFAVLPGLYMVARIDGRSFTRLTKERHSFEAPYDERFRDYMIATVTHLMTCGFRIVYGYTQSDEISLLFHLNENLFQRKLRKLNSVLAGEASASFSLSLGDLAVFDCRISQLPGPEKVLEYFRWRQEDAHRNALNAHCYWTLRKEGQGAKAATSYLKGKSVTAKNEFLFSRGINVNELPAWQKRGVGLYWQDYEKQGFNPKTGEDVRSVRRRIHVEMQLPYRLEYEELLQKRLDEMGV